MPDSNEIFEALKKGDIAKVKTGPSDKPETPVVIKSVKISCVAK